MAASTVRFVRVEKFFEAVSTWEHADEGSGCVYDPDTLTLTATLTRSNGQPVLLQLSVLQQNVLRIRTNPSRLDPSDFTRTNTRTIVQDSQDDLRRILEEGRPFEVTFTEDAANGRYQLTTAAARAAARSKRTSRTEGTSRPELRVLVEMRPFRITVSRLDDGQATVIWQSQVPGLYFTPNDEGDYHIVHAFRKPPTARYLGFGEHGGRSLCKQNAQLVYFNYDNMRYRQVYDQGPLEEREPLYHSDPFFIEVNGGTELDTVLGTFVDNAGQMCIDIGRWKSDTCLLGTRFGDLDFYLIVGNIAADVTTDFTGLVGRPRLKPRYVLGYHQGCYGYEDRGALEWAVDRYRANSIPLDGLHIDVDVQQRYHTFTVDETRFPDPKGMFAGLRDRGIKCSTNITPIISNIEAARYSTYIEGLELGYFVVDERDRPTSPDAREYSFYAGGGERLRPGAPDSLAEFDSGRPYLGRVWYGGDRGTTGHYPDLGRREIRDWWGQQYQGLFDLGLEMVWQDMTTPAIAVYNDEVPYGDMKGFPLRLKLTDDFLSGSSKQPLKKSPAYRIWNLYSYNLHKGTYHGLNNLEGRQELRNFIIGRGCYAGMHRFAGLWTGDNASSWDFLQINVAQVLSLGMCGLSIAGQDIGGFESSNGEQWADPALLMRWTMAGAFLPWFRNHYIRKTSKCFQEPFQYVEWFNQYRGGQLPDPPDLYRKVVPVCRHYISLRYRLLQLFYDALFENLFNGLPICRPMFVNDPGDKALYGDKLARLDDQFFVRKDLLVAPVLEPDGSPNRGSRPVYLPLGSDWYPFADELPVAAAAPGGSEIIYEASFGFDLEKNPDQIRYLLPLYVRAGAILPMLALEQYVGQFNREGKPNPLTFQIYPGAAGEYTLYLDDGVSRASAPAELPQFRLSADESTVARSQYRETRIRHERTSPTLHRINIERLHDKYQPLETYFFIALLHAPAEGAGASGPVESVAVGGKQLPRESSEPSGSDGWWYDAAGRRTILRLTDDPKPIVIEVTYRQ